MNLNTNLFDRGILRTPLHPFEKAENLTKQQIIKIASDKDFQDAISISSFQFYNRLINWLNNGCLDEEFPLFNEHNEIVLDFFSIPIIRLTSINPNSMRILKYKMKSSIPIILQTISVPIPNTHIAILRYG